MLPAKAVLFDAPSAQAKKLFVIGQGYPLEVIVNLGEWVKVRDAQGALSWIEAKQLAVSRTLLVVQAQVELRQSDNTSAPVLARIEKDVVLELLESGKNGWVKVRHSEGLTGYLPYLALWGL